MRHNLIAIFQAAVLVFATLPGFSAGSKASPAGSSEAAIADLAGRVAAELRKAGVTKIAVFDLNSFDDKPMQFGKWLADRISEDVAKAGFPVADREGLNGYSDALMKTDERTKPLELAKTRGADAVLGGTFGALGDSIGISLTGYHVNQEPIRVLPWGLAAVALGKIPVDDSLRANLGISLDALRPSDGIFKTGLAGVGMPTCVHCPQPAFSSEAIDRKWQGTVELEAVIDATGRVTDVRVVNGAGFGLDEKAVKGVKKWKFAPAKDADGAGVPVKQPIQVTFRLY